MLVATSVTVVSLLALYGPPGPPILGGARWSGAVVVGKPRRLDELLPPELGGRGGRPSINCERRYISVDRRAQRVEDLLHRQLAVNAGRKVRQRQEAFRRAGAEWRALTLVGHDQT